MVPGWELFVTALQSQVLLLANQTYTPDTQNNNRPSAQWVATVPLDDCPPFVVLTINETKEIWLIPKVDFYALAKYNAGYDTWSIRVHQDDKEILEPYWIEIK